ncbi:MAG: winged helix-turn-helix domain-containing protein [Erythrobacter sp.]
MTQRRTSHLRIKAQIFRGKDIAIGPGKADLLEAVEQSGSIAAAGRRLGITYRRTRDMIDTLNQCWGCPVVETEKGGKSGGGSRLTPRGRAVLSAYRTLEQALWATADQHGPALLDLLAPMDEAR